MGLLLPPCDELGIPPRGDIVVLLRELESIVYSQLVVILTKGY